MAIRSCPGYVSDDGGLAYNQARHDVQDDVAHFSPGKSQCRECYRAYARDWRERRAVNGGGSGSRRAVGQRARPLAFPQLGAATAVAASAEVGDLVPEDVIAAQRSHRYIPTVQELVPTWHAMVTRSAKTGQHPRPLVFFGPSGCGKTEGAEYLASLVGLPFTKIDAASVTDPESWFGTREVVARDGVAVTTYQPSALVEAVTQPGVLLIDEITRSKTVDSNIFLPLLDGTHRVTNPLTGDDVVRDPRCFVILAGNRGVHFIGTYGVDPALLSRARVIEFDYLDQAAEAGVAIEATGVDEEAARLFARLAFESRVRSKDDEDMIPISTREVISACELVADGLTRDMAVRVAVFNTASPEGGSASVRASLESIWAGIRTQPVEAVEAKPVDEETQRAVEALNEMSEPVEDASSPGSALARVAQALGLVECRALNQYGGHCVEPAGHAAVLDDVPATVHRTASGFTW